MPPAADPGTVRPQHSRLKSAQSVDDFLKPSFEYTQATDPAVLLSAF